MVMIEKPRTQKTQPKKGEPIDIPIPTRKQVFDDLAKSAQPMVGSKKHPSSRKGKRAK